MRRRPLNLVIALSLLLCVAVVVLWVRSFSTADALARFWPSRYVQVTSVAGAVEIRLTTYPRPIPRQPDELRWRYASGVASLWPRAGPSAWNRLGFYRLHLRRPDDGYVLDVYIVPWWPLFLAAALASAALALAARRQSIRAKRIAGGLCPACAYDLRASPGRCPECGTMAAARAA